MAVVVLKFLCFFYADVKGKEIFFTTETNRFSVEKGFFYKLDKELYNISCSFPVWFV